MADRIVRVILRGDVAGFKASMASAAKSASDTANRLTDTADKSSAKWRTGLTSVGDTAGKVGLVAAAGLGAVVLATANFDKQMSEVSAATGETSANMDKLREAAIQAGAETAFSASEAAEGITELAKAGVSTSDILSGGLTGALDLAAAGQIGVGEAAEYSAKAMTQFGLAGDQVPHVADLLAAAAGKAVGEVGDFGQALNQAGLVAAQTGLTIEDTVGTLAAFAQAGLQGSDAGTSLKSMLQRLQNPLGQGAKAMESLGINAYDASGNFIGIAEVAGQLQDKLGGLTQAQRDAAMAQIFGSDAVRAASILYKEGADGIQGWINKTDDAGFAAEQAAAKMDNLAGDWEEFTGSLETALIGSGEGSQGMLRGVVQSLTSVVNAYNALPSAAQGATTAALGVTAALGGGIWAFSKVVQGVSNTRAALDNLGIDGSKATGALKGLSKAVGAVGIAFAGLAIADQIAKIGDKAVPGVEALTGSLIDLANVGASGDIAAQFDGLGASIDRLTDKNTAQKLNDTLAGVVGFGEGGAFREATAQVEGLDAALVQLVQSGGPDMAAQALANLAQAQGLSADETKQLESLLPGYKEALAGVSNDAKLAAGAEGKHASAMEDSAAAAQQEADALNEAIEAMREKRAATIAGLNAEIGYEAALDDARKALKDNGKTLDITTEKGRANKTALLGVASAWNDQSDAAKRAPGAHKAAINSFVDLAKKMGMSEEKARALARRILEIPNKRVTVEADTESASRKIGQIQYELQQLNGYTATTYVQTVYTKSGRRFKDTPASGYATGGRVAGPGTATSDSIPAYLSNGEYVIKAAAVSKYGAGLFDKLNAMKFAEGGAVSRQSAPAPSSGTWEVNLNVPPADVRTLAREIAREMTYGGRG